MQPSSGVPSTCTSYSLWRVAFAALWLRLNRRHSRLRPFPLLGPVLWRSFSLVESVNILSLNC